MTTDEDRPRILVVDDDPGMLRAMSRILGRGCEVLAIESPLAALDRAPSFRPDAALLDLRMPELNGFDLMRRLRERQPGLDVILMTGDSEEPDASLIRAIDEGAFYFIQKPFDRKVLLTLVGRCLELRRLREEKHRYTKRLEEELEEARKFQLSLLPPMEFKGLGVSIAARYLPCTQLAGDFYDYAVVEKESVALIIADVVGHGASAAMMTGIVKSAFHAAHEDHFDPLAVVERVKDAMRAFEEGRFITLCSARFDPRSRILSYVNAGHPPPILYGNHAEARFLNPTAPLVSSAFVDAKYEGASMTLDPGDRLLLYTDGVTEAPGDHGMFGRDRVLSLIKTNGRAGGQLLDELLISVNAHTGERPNIDDMTLLALDVCS